MDNSGYTTAVDMWLVRDIVHASLTGFHPFVNKHDIEAVKKVLRAD